MGVGLPVRVWSVLDEGPHADARYEQGKHGSPITE